MEEKKVEEKSVRACRACKKQYEMKSVDQDGALCPKCSTEADKLRDAK